MFYLYFFSKKGIILPKGKESLVEKQFSLNTGVLTFSKAFENVFLVPFPKDSVDITVELRNNRREATVSMSHTVNPKDILIRHIGEQIVSFSKLRKIINRLNLNPIWHVNNQNIIFIKSFRYSR